MREGYSPATLNASVDILLNGSACDKHKLPDSPVRGREEGPK